MGETGREEERDTFFNPEKTVAISSSVTFWFGLKMSEWVADEAERGPYPTLREYKERENDADDTQKAKGRIW